jgi:hypothetical protein
VDKPPQLAAQHQSRHMAKKIKLWKTQSDDH